MAERQPSVSGSCEQVGTAGEACSEVSQRVVKAVGAGVCPKEWAEAADSHLSGPAGLSSHGEARRESPGLCIAMGQPCSREFSCFRSKCALGTLLTTQQPFFPPMHSVPSTFLPGSTFPHLLITQPPSLPSPILPVSSSALSDYVCP